MPAYLSKINTEWHTNHRMPKNPTLDQRLKWHIEHARHCACRPIDEQLLKQLKKRYQGTHQEFWIYFNCYDHQALAIWAAECAERVLPYFENKSPHDMRPGDAIRTLREWIATGKFHMPVIRSASLAAHAAGQAVATAHVPSHAFGAALYAVKAVAAACPQDVGSAVADERAWQLKHLPKNLRQWVEKGLQKNQRILPPNLRIKSE